MSASEFFFRFGRDERGHPVVSPEHALDRSPRPYRMDDHELVRMPGKRPSDRLADLLELAVAVYLADRRALRSRDQEAYSTYWKRSIRLEVPVRDVDFWRSQDISTALHEAVRGFTEDQWRIDFRAAPPREGATSIQQRLFHISEGVSAAPALFSGGLDSLAGVLASIDATPRSNLLLVSMQSSSRLTAIQHQLVANLQSLCQGHIEWLALPVGLSHELDSYNSDEPSQRSRGFLFLVIGAVVALGESIHRLSMFENGIGALGLPHTEAQLGSHLSRASDPVSIAQLEQLISFVADRQFRVEQPLLLKTKAEACGSLLDPQRHRLITMSVSCDGFPQRVRVARQCGVCTSCILRRQALFAAGLSHADTPDDYRYDILSPLAHIPQQRRYPAQAMVYGLERVKDALGGHRPWRELLGISPRLGRVAQEMEAANLVSDVDAGQDAIMSLYRRYLNEWERFPVQSTLQANWQVA